MNISNMTAGEVYRVTVSLAAMSVPIYKGVDDANPQTQVLLQRGHTVIGEFVKSRLIDGDHRIMLYSAEHGGYLSISANPRASNVTTSTGVRNAV